MTFVTTFFEFIASFIESVFWFLIVLIPLVAIHEFGHLLMARLCGVKINEYGIGMPLSKRWFYKRYKGIVWSFYPWLIGGFVRIYGDNDAIDEAFEKKQTDPKTAKEVYHSARLQELVANRDLEFFLQDNNLEYNQDWQELEKSKYIQGIQDNLEAHKVKHFNRQLDQLKTLIDWEFEQKMTSKDTFFSKNWFQKTLILAGGVSFNFISAILIFWMLFTILPPIGEAVPIGVVKNFSQNVQVLSISQYPLIGSVLKDSSAAEIGLNQRDALISFDGVDLAQIDDFSTFQNLVSSNANQQVEVVYKKDKTGELVTKTAKIEEKQGRTIFGIAGLNREVKYTATNALTGLTMALERTFTISVLNFTILGDVIQAALPFSQDRTALENVGGPVAISYFGSQIFDLAGVSGILSMMAIISVSLAVFNMLPLPVLDGGRWIIITISHLLGRRNRKLELVLVNGTFLILILLSVFIAISDVLGIFQGRFNL